MHSLRKLRLDIVLVGVLVLALSVLSFLHKGVAAAEVELNDGGVWVTNGAKNLIGHLNYDSQTLDGGVRAASGDFDVSQSGNLVLVTSPGLAQPLDTATVAFTGEALTDDLQVAHNADLVLFADSSKGKVWAKSVEESGSFSSATEPTIEKLDDPTVVVGVDGTGYILTADGKLRSVKGSGSTAAVEEIGNVGEVSADAQLTVAGDTPVALDAGRVLTAGHESDLGTKEAVLQQPSRSSDEVLVSTDTQLLRVPVGGGEPVALDVPSGQPASPVYLDGCAYGLWAGSGYYVRDCADESLDEAGQYPELASATNPVYRVNRSVIVINDTVSGAIYLPQESMIKVDNWDLIANQLEEQEEQEEQSEETEQSQLQEFSEEQNPPVATDDDLGARPGTSTTLPILLNDLDVDGDVLTVALKDVPSDVSVALAKDGRAARIQVPGDKVGTVSFTYQASDGVDLSNVATVRVAIRQPEVNGAPKRARSNTINVSERATAEYAVLSDWIDPDGDPLFLENATSDEGMAVTWRPDGYISVRDLGTGGPGRRVVTLQVSDGTAVTTEEMTVQVSPGSSNAAPVANNDHYVANVGEQITITPLANDTDPEDDDLQLVEVGATATGVEVVRASEENALQFEASTVGTQTIVYSISDGPNTSKGKIRVDVSDPEKADPQPAAENDLALLPPNGSVVVEPLTNDYDPAGGVLVIQGVSMGSSKGLNVEVVNHALLRVTAPAGIDEPQSFSYTVSNGSKSATATVLVIPLKVKSETQPPVALPESTVVRTGDIVTVSVLTNDYSPSDLAISLMDNLEVNSGEDLGEFFLAGDTVRYKAGDEAGTTEATYTVEDEEGNVASSTVTIAVLGFNDSNQQPVPTNVEARTLAGMTTRIAIPMDGVDPDGDSVELVGVSGTRLGSATIAGNYIAYEAGETSTGTDTFSYTVRDRFGAEGTGSVRVGVAPSPTINQLPVAVPDEIAARPDTRLEIPVTTNDVDADGDKISIVADSVEAVTKGWELTSEIIGQKVVIQTPAEPGVYQLYYKITDGGGSPVSGVVTVTVDENVPPKAPVAADDYVPTNSIAGLESVEVAVLDNDSDPDGSADALTVSVDAPATVSGGTVTVPLTDDRQIVLYTVTDADDMTARAAIVVPGKDQVAPYLDPTKIPAVVKGGETLTVSFDDYVITRADHSAKLTTVDSVIAGKGGASEDPDLGLKIIDDTTISFTPDKLFIGTTSLQFQVTDGDTIDDPRGLTATLSVPITVESSGLFPPTLRPSSVRVSPGENPLSVALNDMVDDPDKGDNEKMAFSLVSVSDPFTFNISGQSADVSVPADTAVGTTGEAVVQVSDGSTDPQEMTVPLSVITSTRPLMTVSDITETDGRVGTPITWDLTQYVTNPFADVGGEITIVGQPTVTGPAAVSADGTTLTVTPTNSGAAADAAEQVVVTYTVADATNDSSRYRTGIARVTVKDTPKAPVDVAAEYVKSKTVRVTWSHSGWRGGERKGFVVSWGGSTKDCGLQTSCVIDTLTNDQTYQFTVTAQVQEADISDSNPSSPSNAVFVDVAPDTPAAPTPTFGDQSATLSWPTTNVPDGGSPVTKYTVSITPADENGRTQQEVAGASQSAWTWDSLKNGTEYTFTIAAHNKQTELDNRVKPPVSVKSAGVIPAGAPSQQGAPTVDKDKAAEGVAPRATVSWSAPGNANGDSSFTYEMRMTGTSSVLYSGSDTSSAVTMDVSTEDRTFEVRSTNKSGRWSDWSPASNQVRAFQPPGAAGEFSVKPTGVSNQVKFSFSAADGNGAKSSEISYRWSAGGASGTVSSGNTVTSSAFTNGQDVSVTLTAISTVNGETATGGAATGAVNAYAPPGGPSVSASGNVNDVTLRWSMASSSNGRSITAVQIEIQGATSEVGLSGDRKSGDGRNQTRCIRARAKNSEGQWGSWSTQACGSTWGSPTAVAYRGLAITCPSGYNSPCNEYWMELRNWDPSSTVTCFGTATIGDSASATFTVDGNGNKNARFRDWIVGRGIPDRQDASGDCHQG